MYNINLFIVASIPFALHIPVAAFLTPISSIRTSTFYCSSPSLSQHSLLISFCGLGYSLVTQQINLSSSPSPDCESSQHLSQYLVTAIFLLIICTFFCFSFQSSAIFIANSYLLPPSFPSTIPTISPSFFLPDLFSSIPFTTLQSCLSAGGVFFTSWSTCLSGYSPTMSLDSSTC